MLLSGKFQFLWVFIVSLALNFASSAAAEDGKVKRATQRDFNNFVMKFNEKFNILSDRVDRMEQSAGNNDTFDAAHEIITNITRAVSDSNDERANKIEEKLLNKMETFEEKFNKMEEKQNKIEKLLFRLLNASEKEMSDESDGVWGGVTSLFLSTCQVKLTTWANQTGSQLKTKLERMELCDFSELKAVNMCHPNPCLHRGRCAINSTGSDYYCICPKRTSGVHCQNVECAVEKRCWRLNDTLYTVIETQLTWAEAKVKCEEKGMTLAMPKDEERTRLRDQLKPISSHYPYNVLWLGLKREEGGSGWVWVDGSGLGEYTGGWAHMKSVTGSYFGALTLTGWSKMWTWGDATRQWYALCEYQL